MAPRQREPSIERTAEYDEFMKKLEEYHEKRGTFLEREPKAGNRHIDLLRLYKRVCEEGGYDVVSDTKGNKLAWRRIASEFLPGSSSVASQAFIFKSAYYKNLAAYEISNLHKREPPPKEILEDVSAKGGDLLNRTVENYLGTDNKEVGTMANGKEEENEGSEPEVQKTPKEDKMDIDEPGSTGGRITRALRHAPPQRVLFQPEASTARQTRQSTYQAKSPTPGAASLQPNLNGVYGMNGASLTIANYEPRQQVPSAVKPVTTPANNPEHFKNIRAKLEAARRLARGVSHRGMMLPGTGFNGPNIYIRALLALESEIPEEVQYALHHLVKISHERGDKYRFDGFPGLAEALLAKVIEVSSLFYDVRWDVSYQEDESLRDSEVLNGLAGTRDLLQKIHSQIPLDTGDDIQTTEFAQTLDNINEAGLVLRNMVMLEENAYYVSKLPLVRDFITIALNLPRRAAVTELQHYALEIAEQITKYFVLDSEDPLYLSLLAQLNSTDRGIILTTLRAISRISMNLEANNRLANVPTSTLQSICDWLLVEDEELRNACLDFLYQFTAVTDNVELLLRNTNMEVLVNQLVRLLMYNATPVEQPEKPRRHSNPHPVPEKPPKLGPFIIEQLIQIPDEREQSSQWLRTCFEEDPAGEITQIALWQAYNECFGPYLPSLARPLMSAKDFITNVSTTFPGAPAQVLPGNPPKYTIKGVRPRSLPVDAKGRPYIKCLWRVAPSAPLNGADKMDGIDGPAATTASATECGEWRAKPRGMWEHIVEAHLKIMKDENGKYKIDPDVDNERRYECRWNSCRRFSLSTGSAESNPLVVGRHIQTHLPDANGSAARREKLSASADSDTLPTSASKTWLNTQTDERNDAAGLPLASVLVLRNLARQMAKIGGSVEVEEEGGWVRRMFAPVKEQLYYVMAVNQSLREYISGLIRAVAAGDTYV